MIFSRVEVVIPYGAVGVYVPASEFRLPRGQRAEKLTIISYDANAVVQIREDEGAFPLEVQTTEQAADRGFVSFVYVTPISGFRFRCRDIGKTTRISFTAYG